MVPPVKLYDAGRPNRDVLRILVRNSRLPDSLRGDLDSEVSACRLGAARLGALFRRYGAAQVEACFDAILARTTETFRRELLARIPDGTHVWEDYAEHDGVDPPRLHAQRITLTKAGGRLILDFAGTSPQAKGPINHAGDYADGVFLKKWLAPILRNLADTPERMAELDVNEGVVPLIELRFPPPGSLLTPVFPAPTNARTFVILRLLGVLAGVLAKATGGRMPADQETIRYTGFHGIDPHGEFYLMREVLGGGSGGRHYADGSDAVHIVPDSKNLPVEFTETRFPVPGRAARAGDGLRRRGPAARRARVPEGVPHARRQLLPLGGGPLDPRLLGCRGRPGGPALPRHGGSGRPAGARPAGAGRRRADPGRDSRARRDDRGRRVGRSARPRARARGPRRGPGQGLRASRPGGIRRGPDRAPRGETGHDAAATASLRQQLREARGRLPFFDRGPGYRRLAGRDHADVDLVELARRPRPECPRL